MVSSLPPGDNARERPLSSMGPCGNRWNQSIAVRNRIEVIAAAGIIEEWGAPWACRKAGRSGSSGLGFSLGQRFFNPLANALGRAALAFEQTQFIPQADDPSLLVR